ncbi:response regulator transcription factor [Neptunicella sp. SCSIO 80796]|uniref:response regulator transcription factor n=1 Tax=Neptunicella plasticusilytica TaxID=3117012 RepID=UPI003A4D46B3
MLTIDLWKSHQGYLAEHSVALQSFNIVNYLANSFCPGPYFYYVIDSPTLSLDIASPSVHSLLDVPQDEVFTLTHWLDCIHPRELNFFYRCEDVVAWFIKHCISPDNVTKYKISYCLQLRCKDGLYRLFLLQTTTLQTTSEGALLKVFGVQSDISHITHTNNYKLSFIGLDGEPSWRELDVFDETLFEDFNPHPLPSQNCPYSKREIDVIQLASYGKKTAEIATLLNISIQTVNTHRKNLLSKSSLNTMTEVVSECIRKGYI